MSVLMWVSEIISFKNYKHQENSVLELVPNRYTKIRLSIHDKIITDSHNIVADKLKLLGINV